MCDSIPIHIFSIWPSILHLINRMPNPTCSWHSQPLPRVSWGIYAHFLTFPRIWGFISRLPWNRSQATTQTKYFICRRTAGLPIIHSWWHVLVAASLHSDTQRYQFPLCLQALLLAQMDDPVLRGVVLEQKISLCHQKEGKLEATHGTYTGPVLIQKNFPCYTHV